MYRQTMFRPGKEQIPESREVGVRLFDGGGNLRSMS
jgi:hypothetical protein